MARPKNNKEKESIRLMIQARLQRIELADAPIGSAAGAHLDEDALSAFVEGYLGERESAPLIKHLVACGFCRRITAQLIRLDNELGALNETTERIHVEEEPGRLRRFLSDLAARALSPNEDEAVFAYHAPAEDFQRHTDALANNDAEHAVQDEALTHEEHEQDPTSR